jgi:phosphatidylserine/phosphatidylglycerophosphate/cardiolipin synthase-like enzyme
MRVLELTDGGQDAEAVAREIADFLGSARATLELALYDIRLPGVPGEIVAGALREAAGRGVEIRLLYNVDSARPPAIHPPPATRPELLHELPVDDRAVPGIPDLMHHKYAVRDRAAVWTGSTNWTDDSWSREENVIAVVESEAVAGAYTVDFEQIWDIGSVAASGFVDPNPVRVDGKRVRTWFSPGHGEAMATRIAHRIAKAKRAVRVASPVITSGPILGALAEQVSDGKVDVAGVVDATQMRGVYHQWKLNGNSVWKMPVVARVFGERRFTGKESTPYGQGDIHDFMHAKVTVADELVFIGSFNLSHSGESNAENVLEIRDPELAERLVAYVDEIRALYPPAPVPG